MRYAIATIAAVCALPTLAAAQMSTDRAVECAVYGAFARPGDARDEAAKREIQATIDAALASGAMTHEQYSAEFSDRTQVAIDQDSRADLSANWAECRTEFAP
jgi:hypothetical protein